MVPRLKKKPEAAAQVEVHITDYEKQRLTNMMRNNQIMQQLGVRSLATLLKESNKKKSRGRKSAVTKKKEINTEGSVRRNMNLGITALPYWCASYGECWAELVDIWCSDDWEDKHNQARGRRFMMQGASYYQGNRSLSQYARSRSASHGGQPVTPFQAFAMSYKGKATSDVQYNLEDLPSAYSNPSAYSHLSSYIEVAKEVHRVDYNPVVHDLDGEIVMRAGGSKKHRRYFFDDGTLDTASTPTLS